MKPDLDDPKLTAYALGELAEDESAAMEKAIAQSAEAQAWVAEVRAVAATMRAEFGADLFERKPLNIMPLETTRSFWSDNRWSSFAVAAVLAIAALVAAVFLSPTSRERGSLARVRLPKQPADVQMEFEAEPLAAVVEAVGTLTGKGDRFVAAAENPVAAFPIEVGKASYLDVQRTIAAGALPARGSVRLEHLINYFAYDDPEPAAGRPFSLRAEVAGCPWRAEHRLVRIALKAQEGAGSAGRRTVLARDVTAQVEFNPARVASYRLVGYDQARKDGAPGEIHAGDAVTILYEVVPFDTPPAAVETLVVRVHYKQPARSEAQLAEASVTDEGQDFLHASADFKFAAAVAEFGMFLRNSRVGDRRRLDAIAELANDGRGPDPDRRRAGFIELIRQTQLLTRG